MARTTVDFSDAQSFEALERGEYHALIEKVEYREATEEGKYDYLNVELTITEPGFEGRKLWFIWSLSPKALWRMKQSFENLGLPSDVIEIDYDDDTMLVTEPELVGLPLIAVVTQRTYQGQVQNNVDTVLASDEAPAGQKKTATKRAPAAAKKPAGRKFQ